MKVELDLSTEQLENLDSDLTNLLKNLTKEQQTEILKSYIIDKFNKMETTYTNGWGREEKQLTKFGEDLIKGLQEQISESVTEEIMKDENLLNVIQETKNNIINSLPRIMEESISQYIIDKLFNSKEDIRQVLQDEMWEIRNRN